MAAIILSSAAPTVTLTGLNIAYGIIGSYYLGAYPGPPDETFPVGAAVFGAPGTNFNVTNAGSLVALGTSAFDAGIVLGSPGEVKNTGTINAPAGIFILGTTAGAYTANTGTINATKGDGIYDEYGGGVFNAGTIIAAHTGIDDTTGFVNNAGTITAGGDGIFQRFGTGVNSGIILATQAYYRESGTIAGSGVVTYGTFTNTATGIVTAKGGTGLDGVFYSALYNYGAIAARVGIGLGVGSSFYNTGTVTASLSGVYEGFNLDPYAHGQSYITNYKTGIINGRSFGIQIHEATAYIYNAGLIAGATAVADDGVVLNLGTIKGGKIGVVLYGGMLTNAGTISGDTAIKAETRFAGYDNAATITNQGGIISGQAGILASGGAITNTGHIEARSGAGIALTAAGQVYNGVYATGTLAGASTFVGTIIAAGPGISLAAGGVVTNTGTITSGAGDGVDLSSGSALYNTFAITSRYSGRDTEYFVHDGTISGARYGVSLAGAGYIYNGAGAISGSSAAIYMRGVTAASGAAGNYTYLYDRGTLTGTQYGIISRFGTIGIVTYNGARITGNTAILAAEAYINLAAGDVGGGAAGIVLTQGGTVISSAIIAARGTGSTGIYLGAAGGTVIARGDVSADDGIVLAGAGYVYAGEVQGFTIGVDLRAGGTVIAANIYAPDAISITGIGTVISPSFGEIYGNVLFGTSGANRLVLDPSSKIQGLYTSPGHRAPVTVNLDGGTLELAYAAPLNTNPVTIGYVFAFETGGARAITIDKSANWSFADGETFAAAAPITNNGTIRQLSGAGATIDAAITGHGDIDITAGTLTLNGPVGPHQKIDFLTPGTGNLALADPARFSANIENFGLGETIDLTSLSLSDVKSLSFSAGVLTLTETQGTHLTFTFTNPAHFAHETFSTFADGPGTGITLTASPPARIQNSAIFLNNNPFPSAPNLITLQP